MKTLLLLIILSASSCHCWKCRVMDVNTYDHRACSLEEKRMYEATAITDVNGQVIGYGECKPAW